MSENNTPRERFKIEVAAFQATNHTKVLTDADLAAVVKGLTGISVPVAKADVALSDPDSLFN